MRSSRGVERLTANANVAIVLGSIPVSSTAKRQYRQFETNIPRKGIHDRSAYSAAGKYVDRLWEYTHKSLTDT
jgi:hypothetical protein